MNWSLIKESGISYSRKNVDRVDRLCFPTRAQRAEDGSYLISDELGVEKQVPFRFECRTIRLDRERRVVFDTAEKGIDDGFGCLMTDGQIAVLRRTKWQLLTVSPDGHVSECFNLTRFSKRIPRFAVWTSRATFLVVFFNRSFDIDVVEIDRHGRLLWCLPANHPIGIVGSVQLLPSDHLLVADPFRHVALEIDRNGHVVWQFGETENPSSRKTLLASPNSVTEDCDGRRVIADTRNHRVIVLGRDGSVQSIKTPGDHFCDPTYAVPLEDGHYLVCDTGNERVIEVDDQGGVIWEYGNSTAAIRHLSYPRSVDVIGSGRLLVADTANDRVIELADGETKERPFQGEPTLFWPRCARELPSGSLLVADSRNSRILEVSPHGQVIQQLIHLQGEAISTLRDPHDVRMLANGRLLVTDSSRNLVVEVDWAGQVYQVIGDGTTVSLADPHSAQPLDHGEVIITDTGNHRLIVVDGEGQCVRELNEIRGKSSCFRLHSPRYAEALSDGTMVIADTGNNRILCATVLGEFLWEFSQVPNSPQPHLSQPRWATLISHNEVVICDHFHHRVLHVKREL